MGKDEKKKESKPEGVLLRELVCNKKVLFVTTKNIDYIRNQQEIKQLQELAFKLTIVSSNKANYPARLIEIYKKIFVLAICKLIKKGNLQEYDVVFIGFAPQLILPFFRKTFSGKKIIIDFFISVYDTLVSDRQKFKRNSIAAKICHYIDSTTLKNVDLVITDTKAQANFFIEEFGADSKRIETIYLEADKTIYYPRMQKKSDKLRNKVVVLYFGSVLPLQGVDVVLEAIRKFKDVSEVFFDIIGPISSKMNKPIQENVRYIDWLSQIELAEHISQADICLAGHFNKVIEKADRTIPGKAYIYEAMKKDMILGDSAANREIFSEDSHHIFSKRGDAIELSTRIKDYISDYMKKTTGSEKALP
ncbi:glycosyltransferase [Butyrivibrio sp. XPD2006]|uniref:glycosyltransferase n=1 Tax=Butyrivibrio sp. XPD2006 TaxID=1280668 RepID=UPI0003B31C6D|nr:glycosyltransferase [Butyrivibrio sp. XPD2006]